MHNLNIVFLSANKFGLELLREAIKLKEVNIQAIIVLNKKSKTRMYDGVDNKLWYKFGIPVYEVINLNNEDELLESLSPDIILMCGWRQIIQKKILNIPQKGIIGFHPTLLPVGRGPAPIINSIISGFIKSGVTMYYVDEGIDSGDIIGQKIFIIDEDDYAMDVYKKVIASGKELVRKYLPLIAQGKESRIPQNDDEATYFPKRKLRDNEIHLDKESPEEIIRKIRALSKPYLGAYLKVDGRKIVIWKADLV